MNLPFVVNVNLNLSNDTPKESFFNALQVSSLFQLGTPESSLYGNINNISSDVNVT